MSKFKILAVAVAATLAASSAYAVTVTTTPATIVPQNSNQFDTVGDIAAITPVTIAADLSDTYLSRTAPYNVRVTLSSGKINTTLVAGDIVVAGGAASATLVAGTGVAGQSEFVIRVTPAAGGTAVGEGFTVSNLKVDNVDATLKSGGTLSVSGSVSDPTTGGKLPNSDYTKAIYSTIEGVAVTFVATTTPNVIDVGQPSSKKFFTEAASAVGSGTAAKLFNAGQVVITDATGVAPWLANTGTAAVTVSTTDGDFSAFKDSGTNLGSIYLSDVATCATTIGAEASISTDGKTATFTARALSTLDPTEGPATAPYEAYVCFDGNGVSEMTMGNVKASVVVNPGAGFLPFTSGTGSLASMAYNGPVVLVDSFNPATNASIVSFLRITNTSGTTGRVTIKPTCDDGTSPGTAVISALEGGKSVLVEAAHIENGGGAVNLGAGKCAAGKSRLQVVGEIGGMNVQNFMRHNTSIGVINNNVNNQN